MELWITLKQIIQSSAPEKLFFHNSSPSSSDPFWKHPSQKNPETLGCTVAHGCKLVCAHEDTNACKLGFLENDICCVCTLKLCMGSMALWIYTRRGKQHQSFTHIERSTESLRVQLPARTSIPLYTNRGTPE